MKSAFTLLVFNLVATSAFAMGPQIMVANSEDQTVSSRESNEQDTAVIQAQLDAVAQMSEAELAAQLELQAAQIEKGIADAEAQGIEISADQKAELSGLVEGIHSAAKAPHLKKRVGRKLMAIPRTIAHGLGYFGYAIGDALFVPTLFIGPFVRGLIAGESERTLPNVVGYTGQILSHGVALTGTALIIGFPAFPIAIGAMMPIVLTSQLVCDYTTVTNPHTKKYCANIKKNDQFLLNTYYAGDAAGTAVHNAIAWPFKLMRRGL